MFAAARCRSCAAAVSLPAHACLPPPAMLCCSWPLDAAVLAARNKVNGLAAWEAQQIAELQRVLDEGLADDQRGSEEWVDLYQVGRPTGLAAAAMPCCSMPCSAALCMCRRGTHSIHEDASPGPAASHASTSNCSPVPCAPCSPARLARILCRTTLSMVKRLCGALVWSRFTR